ncbi:hypothetical protein [Prevotella sp. P3-122]|uniref:hypothetical protein n=1 Tax=Prevotella sp. P3-122 TaxID=2024223 RepID=UPI001482064A|nr:hypothetical protein [Prevotella sp. P3-122]
MKKIYIIDDDQYGEMTTHCPYIVDGKYSSVVEWIRPDNSFDKSVLENASCICIHSSLRILSDNKYVSGDNLLQDIICDICEMGGRIPVVKYSKGTTETDIDDGYVECSKDIFYNKLPVLITNYMEKDVIDLALIEETEKNRIKNVIVIGDGSIINSSAILPSTNISVIESFGSEELVHKLTPFEDKDIDTIIFSLLSPEYNCLDYAMTIRLSVEELGKLAIARIIVVNNNGLSIEERKEQSATLLMTDGFAVGKMDEIDSLLRSTKRLDSMSYKEGFLDALSISPMPQYGHHSLANEWGLMVLNRFLCENDENIRQYIEGAKNNQLFKYASLSCMDWSGSSDGSIIPKREIIKQSLKAKGGRYLIIDDKADDGWKEVISRCINKLDSMDVISKEIAGYEDIPTACREHIKEGYYDVIFLDFRLLSSEEIENKEIDLFSGMKVLKGIKTSNPGNQVIMLTATNKSWNLKALIDNGADGYYLKESPFYSFSNEVSLYNALNLVECIRKCRQKGYLSESFMRIQTIKANISNNSNGILTEETRNSLKVQLDISYNLISKANGVDNKNCTAFAFVALEMFIAILCDKFGRGTTNPDKLRDLLGTIFGISDSTVIDEGIEMIRARNEYVHQYNVDGTSYEYIYSGKNGYLRLVKCIESISNYF